MVEYIDFALWLGVIGLFFSFGLFMYVRNQPVGSEKMAELAKAKGVGRVIFDRNGWKYHGRVAALAKGAREGGLEF